MRLINKQPALRTLALLAAFGGGLQLQAQTDNRLAQAEQYYAAGHYLTAAGLYGQYLATEPRKLALGFPLNIKKQNAGGAAGFSSNDDILLKQAESYRLAHYWPEAAALYQKLFDKDSVRFSEALYWLAVTQKSLGDYAAAIANIDRFLTSYSGNALQAAAENEKRQLHFIQTQLSRPDTAMYSVQRINSSLDRVLVAPAIMGASQYLITAVEKDAAVMAGVNPNSYRLYTTVRNGAAMDQLVPLPWEDVDAAQMQGAASLSADGKILFLTQKKRSANKELTAIYYALKNGNSWSKPLPLSSVNQEGSNTQHPFATADGKHFFFASDRSGGQGGFDIWMSSIQADGLPGAPTNLGAGVNSAANEQAPFYHQSTQTLVFSADRKEGMGGLDFYTSTGEGNNWGAVENLGHPVNSSRDDIYFAADQNQALLANALINSDRGNDCCLSLYSVTKAPKKKYSRGRVMDCTTELPLANAQVVVKDSKGNTSTLQTDEQGNYAVAIDNEELKELAVSLEGYRDKSADLSIASISNLNWQTDTVFYAPLCLDKKLTIKVENVVTVYFDFDKSELKERGTQQLDSIYNVLLDYPHAKVQISGYTDGKGSAEYNKKLSDRRAKACADYLMEKGIDAFRISFESFGACCPVEMELINGRDNPDGRSMNRRALINIQKD